jgi:hypothetical protein
MSVHVRPWTGLSMLTSAVLFRWGFVLTKATKINLGTLIFSLFGELEVCE